MSTVGFSICCPSCFEWSDWPDQHPGEFKIESEPDFLEVAESLAKNDGIFQNPKLLKCQQPAEHCAAPFQALVFSDQALAHKAASKIQSWAPKYAFRLCHQDHESRWDGFSALVFCSKPVQRRREIQLAQFLDRRLLAHALLGISDEVQAPVTIYAATSLGPEHKVYWTPIEAFSKHSFPVPPRYNPICALCRRVAIRTCISKVCQTGCETICDSGVQWLSNDISETQAIEGEPPWNQCARLLDARRTYCRCYQSDLELIDIIGKKWSAKTLTDGFEKRTCWMGFQEIAVPILVHDHVAAVAMTGQFFMKHSKMLSAPEIIERYPDLEENRDELNRYCDILSGGRAPDTPEEHETAKRIVTSDRLQDIAFRVCASAKQIGDAADATYKEHRARFESVFRQELTGTIETHSTLPDITQRTKAEILTRMREFWAFKKVCLCEYVRLTNNLSLVAVSDSKGPAVVNKDLGKIEPIPPAGVPQPLLREHLLSFEHHDLWIETFLMLFSEGMYPAADAPERHAFHYFVLIPAAEQIYVIAFCERDTELLSGLRSVETGRPSLTCQQAMLETCAHVFNLINSHEARRTWELRQLQHGLKGKTATFLWDISKLVAVAEPYWRQNEEFRKLLANQCVTALTISGPHDAIRRAWVDQLKEGRISVAELYRALRTRLPFYEECCRLWNKGFIPPNIQKFQETLANDFIAPVPELAVGVLDIVVCNSIRLARHNVTIGFTLNKKNVTILVEDDGSGFDDDALKNFESPNGFLSPGGWIGLQAAKRAVDVVGWSLEITSSKSPTRVSLLCPLK